ncbi:MAG: putative phenylalanine aminotransferase [Frankiales bacterium]|nr:putative phenylalanine aminotransferase [Frankiales bacterium]
MPPMRARSTSSVAGVTPPRLRPALDRMGTYRPGRRPDAGQDLSRLASNETPYPLLPSVVTAISDALAGSNRYPDPAATVLTEALAAKHGVDVGRIAVGCGSVQLVQEVVEISCDAGDEVVYGWRSFEAYPTMTAIAGAVPVQVPLTHGHLDLPAMAAAVTDQTRLVLLCSPNNPTGPALAADAVKDFLEGVPDRVLVVLDEAYAEFVDDPLAVDGTRLLSSYPNLLVMRTFSKAYGLAGLRVGYAIAGTPEVATALRQVHLPFAVSVAAQAAALASLTVEDQLLARVAEIVAQREPLRRKLIEIGWDVPAAQGNFVWLPAGADSDRVAQVFEDHGVLVRCFTGEGLRITVATPRDSERVLAAAKAGLVPV